MSVLQKPGRCLERISMDLVEVLLCKYGSWREVNNNISEGNAVTIQIDHSSLPEQIAMSVGVLQRPGRCLECISMDLAEALLCKDGSWREVNNNISEGTAVTIRVNHSSLPEQIAMTVCVLQKPGRCLVCISMDLVEALLCNDGSWREVNNNISEGTAVTVRVNHSSLPEQIAMIICVLQKPGRCLECISMDLAEALLYKDGSLREVNNNISKGNAVTIQINRSSLPEQIAMSVGVLQRPGRCLECI